MKRVVVALALLLSACQSDGARPAATTTTVEQRAVRVAVWSEADPTENTFGGAAVRALLYPQLFRATPEGKWQASLVQPGTDKTRPGATSARFRLRANARWSDGAPITVDDLRRGMDGRYVSAVDEPTASGTIVVHFTQRLPEWRRLWSGLDYVRPPASNIFGGPYKVERLTPGLETVLVANSRYFGPRPRIRQVRLVLVPNAETQARLMDEGELDVMAPIAFTDRRARLHRIKGVRVRTATRGGWTASLVANPERLNAAQRQALFSFADGPRFADVLLHGEAAPTGQRVPSAVATLRPRPAITAPLESPAASLLLHGMQRAAHKAGNGFDLRPSEFDRVLAAFVADDYDALFYFEPGAVDASQSTLVAQPAGEFVRLPLWRERPVAAVRNELAGVSVNGFHVAGPLWNVENWRWAE